jgi:methyl-accepting chemotaxis protein
MAYPQWEWIISAGVSIDDVAATAAAYCNLFLMLVGAAAVVLISIVLVLGRSVSRPVHRLVDNMGSLTQGDLSVVIGGSGCRDEHPQYPERAWRDGNYNLTGLGRRSRAGSPLQRSQS